MSYNSIGKILKLTTWGESHGAEIGAVLDGVPSNIKISESYIQKFLDMRSPGSSKFVTQRKEKDKINIVSGVFNGFSTGTPISLIIKNTDHKSKDYSDIKEKFRPAHADYTYFKKYGIRDYRGGGRSSARETAMRVAAGAIARLILGKKISITGAVIQIGNKKIKKQKWEKDFQQKNHLFCPDSSVLSEWENYLLSIRKSGSSCGALIKVVAKGVPVGLGEHIYGKLDAELASALMGINAVKGVEIGSGFDVVNMQGEQNSDEMIIDKKGKVKFLSNNANNMSELYILGDLFEYWIDDKKNIQDHDDVITCLKNLSKKINIYFQHGNRDFLIGNFFSQHTNIKILGNQHIINNKNNSN